jgi:hypothetical protein
MQDKLFTIITAKVITMMKIRGGRALDELTRPNKGKIRLLSRTEEKKCKGKRNGSRYRAERVGIIHEMTTEEARKEEAKITIEQQGADMGMHIYIMYDVNDRLVDVILEVTPQRRNNKRRETESKKRERTNEE